MTVVVVLRAGVELEVLPVSRVVFDAIVAVNGTYYGIPCVCAEDDVRLVWPRASLGMRVVKVEDGEG